VTGNLPLIKLSHLFGDILKEMLEWGKIGKFSGILGSNLFVLSSADYTIIDIWGG